MTRVYIKRTREYCAGNLVPVCLLNFISPLPYAWVAPRHTNLPIVVLLVPRGSERGGREMEGLGGSTAWVGAGCGRAPLALSHLSCSTVNGGGSGDAMSGRENFKLRWAVDLTAN